MRNSKPKCRRSTSTSEILRRSASVTGHWLATEALLRRIKAFPVRLDDRRELPWAGGAGKRNHPSGLMFSLRRSSPCPASGALRSEEGIDGKRTALPQSIGGMSSLDDTSAD